MALTKEEEQTVRTYDINAAEWASQHASERFWGQEMDRFSELLPNGKVIEIGSGGGRDAKELIAKGYEYTGTDVSEGLLEEAKKVNPDTTFIKQSVYDLDFPNDTFDGFWASAVLLHIPKERIDEAMGKLHGVVINNGIGFISIKQGEGQRIDEETRLFSYWQDDEFQDVLKRNGFEVIETISRPMSERTTWLVYFVRVEK